MKRAAFSFAGLVLAAGFCGAVDALAAKSAFEDQDAFTRVNLRYDDKRWTGSYINYHKLTLLPANSKVHIRRISGKGFYMDLPDGAEIRFQYAKKWGGKPIQDILPELFSASDAADEIRKLSELDQKGIRIGKALEGMSKEGVIKALGPPAAHQTPSTEDDRWRYWENRFVMFNVLFKDGKVAQVGVAGR